MTTTHTLWATAMWSMIAMVAIMALSACSPSVQQSSANWGELSAARSVAKVSNLKSLEQPGMY